MIISGSIVAALVLVSCAPAGTEEEGVVAQEEYDAVVAERDATQAQVAS